MLNLSWFNIKCSNVELKKRANQNETRGNIHTSNVSNLVFNTFKVFLVSQ